MSVNHFETCGRNIGEAVKIVCHDGVVHRGIIERVNRDRVFIRPMERRVGDVGQGPGLFLYGPGWGWGYGAGYGIAFASIAALTILPFLFW
ncbi:hypothetical protein [Sediminibacillus massiliensis]|uniref:hypothetical protein n=1 Tax=Sediminibacillus massiliensis TaxID=1926277 RepID=UPI0009889515|nr:hypothetical protein [Sediminibacillus massiliensis]